MGNTSASLATDDMGPCRLQGRTHDGWVRHPHVPTPGVNLGVGTPLHATDIAGRRLEGIVTMPFSSPRDCSTWGKIRMNTSDLSDEGGENSTTEGPPVEWEQTE